LKNKYIIKDNLVIIFLHRRNGQSELETRISIEDFDKVNAYGGTYYAHYFDDNKSYYVEMSIKSPANTAHNRYTIRMHRIIMDCYDGQLNIDHIDHDTLNNQKHNLRITSKLYNDKNRRGQNSNNTTGYRNVCFYNGKYLVQLQINKKNKLLGKFDIPEEANQFAIKMREKYYGEFAGK